MNLITPRLIPEIGDGLVETLQSQRAGFLQDVLESTGTLLMAVQKLPIVSCNYFARIANGDKAPILPGITGVLYHVANHHRIWHTPSLSLLVAGSGIDSLGFCMDMAEQAMMMPSLAFEAHSLACHHAPRRESVCIRDYQTRKSMKEACYPPLHRHF